MITDLSEHGDGVQEAQSDPETEELVIKAKSVLERLEPSAPKPSQGSPFIAEFSGSPKSGKSTCIDSVAHFFRRAGFRVLAPTEGASKRTPPYLKDDLVAFNAWSSSYALMHIMEALHHSDSYHLAILDRGLYDALAWFELLREEGTTGLSEEDCQSIHKYLLVEKWRGSIDRVYLFTADPATSLERESRDKIIDQPGRAMNSEFLEKLNSAYDAAYESYASEFRNVERIDTSGSSGTTPRVTSIQIVHSILSGMPDKVETSGRRAR